MSPEPWVGHFPWLQDWGEINNNLFFRTFLYYDYAKYLRIKKKSIDHFSYWWRLFNLSAKNQIIDGIDN